MTRRMMMSKKAAMLKSDHRGSILVAVLWSLFFLSALALVLNVLITPQLGLAARLRDRTIIRYIAQAGVQRAIIEIREDETQDYDAQNEPWGHNEEAFKEIPVGDEGTVSVTCSVIVSDEDDGSEKASCYGLIDEERKLNINSAPPAVLTKFFEAVGEVSAQDAAQLADAIVDWRDEDDEPLDGGAEDPYYKGLPDGYECKDAPFDLIEELLLIKDMEPGFFLKVRDYLTVYGAGQVNINTAYDKVLRGLGFSEGLVERIALYRQGSDGQAGTEDDGIFESAEDISGVLSKAGGLSPTEEKQIEEILELGLLGVRSDNFRGYATGAFIDGSYSANIDFVISREEKIRYWKEE